MRNKSAVLVSAIVLTLEICPSESWSGDNLDEMKSIYDKGVELYDQGKYEEAAAAFRELVKARPMHQYYYNIGECEYLRQRFDLAKEAFDTYLKQGGHKTDPKRRRYAEEVLEKITPEIGYMSIDEAFNKEVWVDNEHRGATPAPPIVVMPGDRIVVLKQDGEEVFRTKVTVERGETTEVKVRKEEEEAPPPQEPLFEAETATASLQETPPPKKASPLKVAGIVMIGTGSAIIVAGAVTGGFALEKADQLENNCPDKDHCDASNKNIRTNAKYLIIATNGLIATGAVLATAGIVLTIIGYRQGKPVGETISAAPMIDGTTAGMAVHGRF